MVKLHLQTRVARFLFLCMAIFVIGGVLYQYQKDRVLKPTEFYFRTTDSDYIDINSPTKKVIISMYFMKNYDLYFKNCDFAILSKRGIFLLGAEHKGVFLCNTNNSSENDFKTRNLYFREKVDELWNDYYAEHAKKVFVGGLTGVAAWLSIFAIMFLVKWVARGK
jgi:hypothetical protein